MIGIYNLFNAINWASRYIKSGYNYGLSIMLGCGAAAFLMIYGFIQIFRKKLKLQKERILHE